VSDQDTKRRLAAILCADVAGYSRLMGADEEATLETLSAWREIFDKLIAEHDGRLVGSAGDSVLAEFASPVEATRCALAVQTDLSARNAALAEERRMRFRIGINLGDVIAKGGDLFGDGVNVAARLEALAEPGGICISGAVYDQVHGKLDVDFRDLGPQSVKNIAEPVRVYRIVLDGDAAPHSFAGSSIDSRLAALRRVLTPMRVLAALVGLVLAVAFWPISGPAPERAARAAPIISVVPFRTIGGNAPEGFSEGLTEDLITALSSRPGWRVVRLGSEAQAGRRAGTERAYHFEGSVRRVGDTVRVSAQLVDPQSGFHLWGGRYDRKLVDELAIQNEVTQRIVATLSLRVQDAEAERYAADESTVGVARGLLYRGLTGLGRLAELAVFLPQGLIDWVSGATVADRPEEDSVNRVDLRVSGVGARDNDKQDWV
jgi:class 3 adenylate cyclase/TolB-like protein